MAGQQTPSAPPLTIWKRGKRIVERVGIYLFSVSLILFTQINWIMEHKNYRFWHVEERLFFGFLAGMLVSSAVITLTRKWAVKAGKDADALVKDLSIALSPGILFFFAAKDRVFLVLGGCLCALLALYIWNRPFRNLVDSVFLKDAFKNILTIKDAVATIELSGAYDKADVQVMQCFLRDLVVNFHACRRLAIDEVVVNFFRLTGDAENEVVPVIESIARCFALRVVFERDRSASRGGVRCAR